MSGSAGPSGEEILFTAADGRQLAATWWAGPDAAARALVFVPALAAPRTYLRSLARWLAAQGWGVLTFDYRGVGDSRVSDADEACTLDDWATLDLPGAVAEARRRVPDATLTAVAHSVGGQLFGMSGVHDDVDAALFIAVQRGLPRLYKGRARLRIEYAYAVMPLLYRMLGRLPVSPLTFPVPCPGAAVSQWVRWGRSGVFTDRDGHDVESRFARFDQPILAVTIADDHDYAPAEAVAVLNALYTGADLRTAVLDPADHGRAIGHFGWASARAPITVRQQLVTWLRGLEEGR